MKKKFIKTSYEKIYKNGFIGRFKNVIFKI